MDGQIRIRVVIFTLFLCFIGTIHRIEAVNKNIPLNGVWSFKTDPYNKGIEDKWYSELMDISTWQNMQVPGNWDIENEYSNYAGKAWYSRTFFVEADKTDKMIRLIFESVYNDAIVWINGQKVGENHLGFLSFSFDIDKYLKFGEENKITVLVDNTFKRGAMWNWGGIRRPVWLEVTEKERLEYIHITAIPDLKKMDAAINVKFELSNNGILSQKLDYEINIVNAEKKIVYNEKALTNVSGGEKKGIISSIFLPKNNVNLWHFDSPYLYTCNIKLKKEGKVIHELNDRFGIRKIEVKGESFLLNGEAVRTVGFNLVPEDRTIGSTLPMWRIMEDVDLMKSIGANMARLNHQPLPKSFLDYLDEKGIMTFEEVALWGKDEMVDPEHPTPKEWLARMIKERFNHPSIIGWSVGNEIGYPSMNPKVREYVEGAIKHSKQLDSTRLAVYVSNSAHINKNDAIVFSDMIMLNRYSNWGEDAIKTNTYYPGKPIFYSEFGNKITSEDPNLGFINVAEMLSQMRDKPYIVGASYWTFNDYRSSYSGTPSSGNRSWGVVTTTREKKRAYYQFRKEYAPVRKMFLKDYNNVIITPREIGDIPSYSLEDYKVIWQGLDVNGQLIEGGFQYIGALNPGDQPANINLDWKKDLKQFSSIRLSLVSALGYSVMDTIALLVLPRQPEVLAIHTDIKSVRVIFKQSPLATAWKVRYTDDEGTIKETAETINNFVEIHDLKYNKRYQMELIALNNFGESKPHPFEVTTSSNEKPPVIWSTICEDNTCNISFSSSEQDYTYQIQYRDTASIYDENSYLQLPHKGMIRIDGLKEDTKYFIRMRRLMEWGFASDWSHDIEVETTKESAPKAPKPIGIIEGKGLCILSFTPPPRADGYVVRITDKRTQAVETINIRASRIDFIHINKQLPLSRGTISIASTLNGKESEIKHFKY
ncbi:MAG: hypothetical protein LBV71_09815 [Prevotella sp.]|jgi:hypothetical protein|nr:hypothetical protein [Prevotella sp.]